MTLHAVQLTPVEESVAVLPILTWKLHLMLNAPALNMCACVYIYV